MKRCLIFVVALTACNSREPMAGQIQVETFMGAIPNSFHNSADAANFEAAAAKLASDFGTTASALALTSNEGLPLAPAQPAADGLVELDGCTNLAAFTGGFMLRTALDHAVAPNPATLAGQSCDAALAAAGVTFAGLVQGLQTQAGNLGHLALTADACTSVRSTPRQPTWAALGYWFPAGTQLMPVGVWKVPTALFEGGTDGQSLALRSEVDTAAVTTGADGTTHRTAQWAGVGAIIDLATGTATTEKSEVLALRDDVGSTRTRDDALTRDSYVTIHVGDAASVDESTTYRLYKGPLPMQLWDVTLHGQPAGTGALAVDLTVTQQDVAPTTVKLLLAPNAEGSCVATTR